MNTERRTLLQGAALLAATAALAKTACAAETMKYTVVCAGLGAPEGPKYMADGSILICEMALGRLSRVRNGKIEVIADLGGSPNGVAIGPDGAAYVANDGGLKFIPGPNGAWTPSGTSDHYVGGSIQRVDLKTGAFREVYRNVNGNPLSAPNDLVFDNNGGIWFSDAGATKGRQRDLGGIYYCKADGSGISEIVFPLLTPNGITMSPDKKTLYLAMTAQRQILSFQVEAPGVLKKGPDGKPEQTVFASIGGLSSFDSMTMEADGTLVAASPQQGLIKLFRPDGTMRDEIALGENGLTNVTFGGPDMKTLYITLTRSGRLVSMPWPRVGLKPANQ